MLLLAAPALLAVAGAAQAQPASALGVYSNVRLSPVSGDLGGMELQLRRGRRGAEVGFVLCEGWCNHAVRVPVTIDRNGRFRFDYVEPLTDENGRPARPNVTRFEARLVPGAVIVSAPRGDIPPTRLPRRSNRLGLNAAEETAREAR
jgi:hypothetical protein